MHLISLKRRLSDRRHEEDRREKRHTEKDNLLFRKEMVDLNHLAKKRWPDQLVEQELHS